MIYFIKFTENGILWRYCYAESLEEEDTQLILRNIKVPLATLDETGARAIRTLDSKELSLDCRKGEKVAFAFRVKRPFWF